MTIKMQIKVFWNSIEYVLRKMVISEYATRTPEACISAIEKRVLWHRKREACAGPRAQNVGTSEARFQFRFALWSSARRCCVAKGLWTIVGRDRDKTGWVGFARMDFGCGLPGLSLLHRVSFSLIMRLTYIYILERIWFVHQWLFLSNQNKGIMKLKFLNYRYLNRDVLDSNVLLIYIKKKKKRKTFTLNDLDICVIRMYIFIMY